MTDMNLSAPTAPAAPSAPQAQSELVPTLVGWALRLLAWTLLVLLLAGIALVFLDDKNPLKSQPLVNAFAVWHYNRMRDVQTLLNSLFAVANTVVKTPQWVAKAVVFTVLLVGSQLLQRGANRCFVEARYRRFKREYDEMKARHHLPEGAAVLSPAQTLLEQVRAGQVKDRNALLRVFAETKRKLDEIGRDLAFLSLDVVGSTDLKRGEEKAAVEHDFKAFQAWVESVLRGRGALKVAWTPDGAMAAFPDLDEAVTAAQTVLDGLENFNSNTKVVRKPFAIRCGVNSGYVYFEPDAPLETLSDRVLDIAAHLQRAALPNSLCVARPAIEPLRTHQGFAPTGRIVDGYEVYEWKRDSPKTSVVNVETRDDASS